jgi:hypothetical protein
MWSSPGADPLTTQVVGTLGATLRDVDFLNKRGGRCRLTAFVLYVDEVLTSWPETDRLRRLVSALLDEKRRGYI